MSREKKFSLFLAVAIIGGIGLALCAFIAINPIRGASPNPIRIIAGTLVVSLAMIWACYFTVRAHFAQDEFKRQREISASFWGGWLAIAASAPVFFFIAVGGFGPLAAMHIPPMSIFTMGYVLAPIFGAVGTVGARVWLLYRDGKQ